MTGNWSMVQRILGARGLANADGISRTVRAGVCRRCHAPILTGLDSDVAALPARVDPEPVDQAGELLAVLAGRATYALRRAGLRLELDARSSFHMKTPPGNGRFDVLAEHACGTPPLPTTASALHRGPAPTQGDSVPVLNAEPPDTAHPTARQGSEETDRA